MSLCRRTVEDRLPLERVPLACTFGSPLDLHVRQSLSLQGPVDLDARGRGGDCKGISRQNVVPSTDAMMQANRTQVKRILH